MAEQTTSPSARSSFAYTPKFELWYNGIVWQALYNVVNSYSVSEVTSVGAQGETVMFTHVPDDLFKRRVLVLFTVVSLGGWGDGNEKWLEVKNKTQASLDRSTEDDDSEEEVKPDISLVESFKLFSAILDMLHGDGRLRFRRPRDAAE